VEYISNLKKPTLAKLDELETEWRKTAERQIDNLEGEWRIVTPEVLDELGANEAWDTIDWAVEDVVQLALNIKSDFEEWGKIAKARIKALAKAKKMTEPAKALGLQAGGFLMPRLQTLPPCCPGVDQKHKSLIQRINSQFITITV
jgi:hypothetical protein